MRRIGDAASSHVYANLDYWIVQESSNPTVLYSLKVHLQRKLNDAGIRRSGNVASGGADGRASAAKSGIRKCHIWIGPLRMVEQVEELPTELEAYILMTLERNEVLDEAHVHIPEVRTAPSSFAGVAIGSECRFSEHCRVEPRHTVNAGRARSRCASVAH